MVAKSSTFGDEGMTDDAVRTRLVIRAERVRQRHATGEARVARSASHRWQQLVGNKRPGECVYVRTKIEGVGCVGVAPEAIKSGCNRCL
jgi:hypothetical protein